MLLETMVNVMKALMSLILLYFLFSASNVVFGTVLSFKKGDKFCWKRFSKGIAKMAVLLVAVCMTTLGTALLPVFTNELTQLTGVELIDSSMIDSLSNLGVYGSIITGIGMQAIKAISNCGRLFKAEINDKGDIEIPTA